MAFHIQTQKNQSALGITGFTGAAPKLVTGSTLATNTIEGDSLSVTSYAKATTNTLTITGSWQVSDDGSTWRSFVQANNPANVTLVTGTGSAVIDNRVTSAPSGICGKRYARFLLTSGTGSGGGAGTDEGNVSYNYRRPEFTSPNNWLVTAGFTSGTVGLTGAAPQTGAGLAVDTQLVETGTLVANVHAKATTNTLTITGQWQVSDDNSAWVACAMPHNPTNVIIVTGTGSAVVGDIVVAAPLSVYGKPFARYVVITGVGVGGGAGTDEFLITYGYRKPEFASL